MPLSESSLHLWESLYHSLAEGIILGVMLACLFIELFVPHTYKPLVLRVVAVSGVLMALTALLLIGPPTEGLLFFGHLAASPGLQYVKALLLFAYLFSLLLFDWDGQPHFGFTYPFLLAALVLGTLLLAAAHSFLALYLSMALSGAASYLLCSFGAARQSRSVALKYILFGLLGGGALLYGFSLLYGLGGSEALFFGDILHDLLAASTAYQIVPLVLIVLGLSFKLGVFPMHFWVPGVYNVMPLPVLAYLSTGTKIAVWVLLYRLSSVFLNHAAYGTLLGVLAGISFLWGNLSALSQQSMRKLLAYSSVAYGGLFLLPIAAGEGEPHFLLYGYTFYLLAQYIAFASLVPLESQGVRQLSAYELLSPQEKRQWGLLLALALIALSGLPPFAGFTTKFLIFSSLLKSPLSLFWILSFMGLLSGAWALFYYIKPLYVLFLKTPGQEPLPSAAVYTMRQRLRHALLWVFILLLLALFLYPMPIFQLLTLCLG